LNAGVGAFNRGDCNEAISYFERIRESFDWGVVNAGPQSEQLTLECVAFLRTVVAEQASSYGLALTHYIDFPSIYPASGLNGFIPARVAALFGQASIQELAIRETCDRVALLGESGLLPRPSDQLPQLYYHCGQTYHREGDLHNALAMYMLIRTDHPNHPIGPQATKALADVKIEIAEQEGAGAIEQPPQSGSAPIGTSVYVVQNDSPERIQLTLSGPEVLIEELPECQSCQKFTKDPQNCPEKGPVGRYTLKPGKYEVLVESITDEGIIPFRGTWTFESGTEYSECYYVVTRLQP